MEGVARSGFTDGDRVGWHERGRGGKRNNPDPDVASSIPGIGDARFARGGLWSALRAPRLVASDGTLYDGGIDFR
ncbi:MAG: hypothetical protein H0V37_02855 [Chloroflexia bacterium]|nr:hypothetical protein [Chloroflexia bacterium]